jgi:site-specific recombinase XerD
MSLTLTSRGGVFAPPSNPVSVPPDLSPVFPVLPAVGSIIGLPWAKVQAVKNNLNDPGLKTKVSNRLSEKIVLDELQFSYDVSGINFSEELDLFLSTRKSAATKNNYKNAAGRFVKWCANNGVKPLEVRVQDIDRYQGFLTGTGFADKSVRTFILGASSFYTFMFYRHPKVFKVNPFTHRNLPPDRTKKPMDYITIADIRALKKEFARIGRLDMACVVDLLTKYGWRIGAFETMRVGPNGRYTFHSKGSEKHGQFTKAEHRKIIELRVLDIRTCTMKNIVKKYTNKLFKNHEITAAFSPHDIRRYYINKYADDTGFRKFLDFSRGIHKNIATTVSYLYST